MFVVNLKVDGSERLREVREFLGNRQLHPNLPQWWVEFQNRDEAQLAVVNLNLMPGVRASLCDGLQDRPMCPPPSQESNRERT